MGVMGVSSPTDNFWVSLKNSSNMSGCVSGSPINNRKISSFAHKASSPLRPQLNLRREFTTHFVGGSFHGSFSGTSLYKVKESIDRFASPEPGSRRGVVTMVCKFFYAFTCSINKLYIIYIAKYRSIDIMWACGQSATCYYVV